VGWVADGVVVLCCAREAAAAPAGFDEVVEAPPVVLDVELARLVVRELPVGTVTDRMLVLAAPAVGEVAPVTVVLVADPPVALVAPVDVVLVAADPVAVVVEPVVVDVVVAGLVVVVGVVDGVVAIETVGCAGLLSRMPVLAAGAAVCAAAGNASIADSSSAKPGSRIIRPVIWRRAPPRAAGAGAAAGASAARTRHAP
jgi:hypothetical protein